MDKDFGLTFEYGFENDSSHSYLVLKLNNDIKLFNHQTEIICQNPNSAFLPFHIRRENDNVSIYYDITSKISLLQYLERKALNKKELLDLLKSIVKGLIMHSNYLLDLSSYVIDPNLIYVNPASAEISFVYIPTPGHRDTMKVLGTFIKDIVVNAANIDYSENDNYIQRLLNCLKTGLSSLADFNRLLTDLKDNSGLYSFKETVENEEPQINREQTVSISTPVSDGSADKRIGKSVKKIKMQGLVIFQIFVVITVVSACLFMASKKIGDRMSIAGVLIIAAAADVLITKRMLPKAGVRDERCSEQQRNTFMRRGVSPEQGAPLGEGASSGKGIPSGGFQTPDILRASDTVIVPDNPSDNYPYLEGIGDNRAEKIIISKNKFIIGRLDSMADYVMKGNTIGKLHAEIFLAEGSYHIRDLNSKNGTYINGVRIPSNKEWAIKSNDRIKFSDLEYIFRQRGVLY